MANTRPFSVTVIGWLFIAAGTVGIAYHATELNLRGPIDLDEMWVLGVRLLAIVGGVFVLRGANWARWLVLAWIAYHVVLSTLHSLPETMIHLALLLGIAVVLLRPEASVYFRGRGRRLEPPAA